MRTAGLILFTFFCGSVALHAGETATQYAEIAVSSLPDPSSKAWGPEQQYVQADKEGRIFLLRRDSFDLYQITSSGEIVSKGRLVRDDKFEIDLPVHSVSMSPNGDTWLLQSVPNSLHVFQSERVTKLEIPWMPAAVVANGGEPLVAVMAAEMNTTAPTMLHLKRPPLLLQFDGKRWNTVAEGRFPTEWPEGVEHLSHMEGEYNVFLGLSPERRLWMADEFAYRLRRFSPSFVPQDEITVGEAKIDWKERPEEEWKAIEKLAKKGGMTGWSRRSLPSVRAEPVFRSMTVGRDGVVYLLVRTEQGPALDRFHPALLSLDRVLLKGLNLQSWAKPTMALGTQGLLIAPLNARDGIWQIDAETLDQADWRPVPGAMLNGQPLLPPKDREKVVEEPAKPSVKSRKAGSQR